MKSTAPQVIILLACPECGAQVRKRRRNYDGREFLGCTKETK